jgi:hypothetical protein
MDGCVVVGLLAWVVTCTSSNATVLSLHVAGCELRVAFVQVAAPLARVPASYKDSGLHDQKSKIGTETGAKTVQIRDGSKFQVVFQNMGHRS